MTVLLTQKKLNKALNVDAAKVAFNCVLGAAAWAIAYIGLPVEPAIILGILMILDFPAGIASAWATGEEITSARMKRGMVEKFLTMLVPFVLALVSTAAGTDWQIIIVSGTLILIFAEAYSILSNLVRFKTGERLPEVDAVALLANKFRKLIEKLFDEKW